MFHRISVRLVCAGLLLASVAATAGPSSQVFRVRDDCDPATFNAAIGPNTCVNGFDGGTTFDEFLAELQEDQEVGPWRFNPDEVRLDRGQPTRFESRGGEFHTFTRVQDFGGGVVPLLNELMGEEGTRPECIQGADLAPPSNVNLYVPAGAALPGPTAGTADLPRGTTKWQCCIHPWMRSTVQVR
jgi:hypothetical protein